MYEIIHQATFRFLGINEGYKLVIVKMYQLVDLLRNLNMNTPKIVLSQLNFKV